MKAVLFAALALCLGTLVTAKANAMGCREGQTEIFWENVDSSGESMQPVYRTCHHGSFYPREAAITHRGCREGQVEIFLENVDSSGESMQPVRRVCHHGSFYPCQAPITHRGCTEGQREIFWEDDGSGEHMSPNAYVCTDGRFVRTY